MTYMLLIMEPPGQRGERSEAEGRAAYAAMLAYADRLKARGLLTQAQALTSETSRVEVRAGKARTLDGPFAEAKEVVGGFFLLEVATRAEAEAIAAECPAAQFATVEVREFGPCFM